MSYSQYFDFSSGPELKTGTKYIHANTGAGGWTTVRGYDATYDYVSDGVIDQKAADEFDKIMAGHDQATAEYTNTLKSLYNNYSKYATEYQGNVQPIIDALTGDIADMQDFIGEYKSSLEASKDDFENGLIIDPNASRTRAEYMGAVSDQYDTARESLRKNMASQGLNPYANKGADRELALNRAKDIGLASGKAYSDWKEQYNRDKQANLGNKATYLGLLGNVGGMYGDVMNARAGLGGMYGDIMNAKTQANQLKATGMEGLANQAEARRQEALSLGQQQQANKQQANDIRQQLSAKLTENDKRIAAYRM